MSEQQSRAEELKRKRDHWKHHIEGWQSSGLPQREYCRHQHLSYHQFGYWKKRFFSTETGVSFVPLKLEDLLDTPAQPEHASLCLVINNHFKVEIRAGFDSQLLRQLIFALRGLA